MNIKEELDSALTKSIKYVKKQLKEVPEELRNFYLLYLSNDILTMINSPWYIIDGDKK